MKPPLGIVTALIFSAAFCAAQTESKPAAAVASPDAPAATATTPATAAIPQTLPLSAAPKPPSDSSMGATPTYVIGPLDVLDIRVWNNANLSGFFPVGPDGVLSMPLIGEIKAAGLTRIELTKLLKEKLSAVINEPEVNVQPSRINSKNIYILGGVNRQGEMAMTGNMTVLDAISNCGGFRDFANPKKIYILRGTQKFNFNYKDVSKGKHMEQNILLQNGDHIFVPE